MNKRYFRAFTIISLVLVITLGCSLTGSTSEPAASGKEIAPLETKTAQIDSAGGELQVGGMTLAVGASNILAAATVTLEKYPVPPASDGAPTARSEVYALSGLPADFQGMVRVTIPIPESILDALDPNDSNRGEKIVLSMGVPVYTPSAAGLIYREVPLDAQVDLSAKQVTAQVDFVHSMAGGAFGKMAAPAYQFEAGLYTSNNSYFRLYYDEQEETAKADSHNFTISIPPGVGSDVVATLMDTLEASKARIEEMGFSFSPFGPGKRFPVIVQDCDYKDGKFGLYGELVAVDGMYSHPWGNSSTEASYLCLSARLLGDTTKQKATAGHELMHLFQYISYADRGYGVFARYTMLDEATAVWFESLVAGEEEYLPNVALNSLDFIRKPWFFSAGGKDAQDLGYGASWFLRCLVNEYDEDLVYQAYAGGYSTGENALGTSVVDNTDTILGQAFADFLPAYMLYSDSLAPGLGDSEKMLEFQKSRGLELRKSAESDTVLTFRTRLQGVEETKGSITTDGKLDPAPTAVVTRTLGGLNADFLVFSLNGSSPVLQEPGILTIQVTTSQLRSGVMVYGIPSEDSFGQADALASPQDYLSSDGKATLVIPNISAVSGDADYDQIMVIFFNMNDDPEETSQIGVTLTWSMVKTDRLGVALTANDWKYPDTICDLQPSGCRVDALTLAPACIMGDSSGGGGGGGGEGESSVDNRSSCSPIPDWCWQCGDVAGGWQFTNKYRLFAGEVATALTLQLNEDGIVTGVFSDNSQFQNPPAVLTHNGQNLYVEWQNLEDGYNNLGYVILDGNLTAAGGSGFWRMGHPGPGDSIFGQWTALPCDQFSLTTGFGCISSP